MPLVLAAACFGSEVTDEEDLGDGGSAGGGDGVARWRTFYGDDDHGYVYC
jgi:hypothetical protein